MNDNVPPVKVGDELDLTIDSVGVKGDGIAKVKGFVIFVPNTKKGKSVKVRITKVLKSVGFAEVIGKSEIVQEEPEPEPEPEVPKYEDTENFGED